MKTLIDACLLFVLGLLPVAGHAFFFGDGQETKKRFVEHLPYRFERIIKLKNNRVIETHTRLLKDGRELRASSTGEFLKTPLGSFIAVKQKGFSNWVHYEAQTQGGRHFATLELLRREPSSGYIAQITIRVFNPGDKELLLWAASKTHDVFGVQGFDNDNTYHLPSAGEARHLATGHLRSSDFQTVRRGGYRTFRIKIPVQWAKVPDWRTSKQLVLKPYYLFSPDPERLKLLKSKGLENSHRTVLTGRYAPGVFVLHFQGEKRKSLKTSQIIAPLKVSLSDEMFAYRPDSPEGAAIQLSVTNLAKEPVSIPPLLAGSTEAALSRFVRVKLNGNGTVSQEAKQITVNTPHWILAPQQTRHVPLNLKDLFKLKAGRAYRLSVHLSKLPFFYTQRKFMIFQRTPSATVEGHVICGRQSPAATDHLFRKRLSMIFDHMEKALTSSGISLIKNINRVDFLYNAATIARITSREMTVDYFDRKPSWPHIAIVNARRVISLQMMPSADRDKDRRKIQDIIKQAFQNEKPRFAEMDRDICPLEIFILGKKDYVKGKPVEIQMSLWRRPKPPRAPVFLTSVPFISVLSFDSKKSTTLFSRTFEYRLTMNGRPINPRADAVFFDEPFQGRQYIAPKRSGRFDLSALYDLSQTGVYRLTVIRDNSRRPPRPDAAAWRGRAVSNTVRFSIR